MATVTRTDGDTSSTDAASYNFTATIGADGGSDSLYFFIGARSTANGTLTGLTVDGVAATEIEVKQQVETGSVVCVLGLFAISRNSLPTPANTTVALVASFSATMLRCGVDTFVSPNAQAVAFASTPAGSAQAGGSISVDCNVNAPLGGIVIGGAFNGDTAPWGWTGLTEAADTPIESNNAFSTAAASAVAAATPRTISVATATSGAPAVITASFAVQLLTLAMDHGSFAVSGQDVTLQDTGTLLAEQGAFAVAGQDITFQRSYRLNAEAGVFGLTGINVVIPGEEPDYILEMGTGVFTGAFGGISAANATEDIALTKRPLS